MAYDKNSNHLRLETQHNKGLTGDNMIIDPANDHLIKKTHKDGKPITFKNPKSESRNSRITLMHPDNTRLQTTCLSFGSVFFDAAKKMNWSQGQSPKKISRIDLTDIVKNKTEDLLCLPMKNV